METDEAFKQNIKELRDGFRDKWNELSRARLQQLQERAHHLSGQLADEGLTFEETTMILIDLIGQGMMNIHQTMAKDPKPGDPSADDLSLAWLAEMSTTAQRLVNNEIRDSLVN